MISMLYLRRTSHRREEVTIDSYSESISSHDEESSDDRTVTADSDSSVTPAFQRGTM